MKVNKEDIKKSISRNIETLELTFDHAHLAVLEQIIIIVAQAIKNNHTILLCGNGGSAADSQHIAAELVGRFKKERASFPAIALTTDTSILTAVANDYAFDEIFARQVQGLGRKGDVLIGISTSGNSPNVIRALEEAKQRGIKTIAFTGQGGGRLASYADVTFSVESTYTPHIQTGHIIALHAMCEAVENMVG